MIILVSNHEQHLRKPMQQDDFDKVLRLRHYKLLLTGCCHVTLIYGLFPPIAGRNRVNYSRIVLTMTHYTGSCQIFKLAVRLFFFPFLLWFCLNLIKIHLCAVLWLSLAVLACGGSSKN